MKKVLVCMAALLLVLMSGCEMPGSESSNVKKPELEIKTETVKTEETLISEPYEIIDWGSYGISKEKFENVKAGDTITFKVCRIAPAPDGMQYWVEEFRSANWNNYYNFSDFVCTPEPHKTTETKEDGSIITKLSFNNNETYAVTITLSESEAETLKKEGLLMTGHCFKILEMKVSYDKTVKTSDLSFDEQYALFADYRNSVISNYSRKYNVPMIFVTTENREPVLKKEYYTSMIDVVNCSDSYKLSKKGQVKVRGNSTADDRYGTDKPYRIKFESKQNMLGLHEGQKYKSWVLLKAGGFNAQDYLGFNLAHEIYKTSSYQYYASDCAFVHVFVNDEYKGVYLLCEQSQVNKGRVDVDENKEKSKENKIGYMIELDNYAWDDVKNGGRYFGDGCSKGVEDYHFNLQYLSSVEEDNIEFDVWGNKQKGVKITDVNGEARGCPIDDFTVKSDIYSDAQVEFIKKYTKNLWNICYEAIEKGKFYKFDENYNMVPAPEFTSAKDVCDAVVDLESLCNEIILEELVRDNDVGAGSLYMAIDFTKTADQKYGKFTFECPWDFNWGYAPISSDRDGGAYWTGKTQYFAGAWQNKKLLEDEAERSHPWFILFNNAPWFRQMLRAKWNKIGTANLKAVAAKTDSEVQKCGKDIGGASAAPQTDFVRSRIDYIEKHLWK